MISQKVCAFCVLIREWGGSGKIPRMDDLHIYHEVETLLRQEERFCTDSGALNKNVIVEAALALDDGLLRLLLNGGDVERCFFQTVGDTKVFDKVKFQRFIRSEDFLPGNYTLFKKKIGLANEDQRFISESREVVLDWPYKDCILEGGQTKEDAKRDEIFWNETLAPDEINRLKEPKAFANFAHYDRDGRHSVSHLKPTDNLIIKGNNLLALYSLEKRYAGKVKLIYIDPPYYFMKPKPSDTFSYNSNFRLSTWLVFMRDRLKVANEVLSNEGVILCHIKEDAIHWLKALMEEIFGVDNFVETFIWKNTDNPDSLSKKSRSSVEYVLCYEKNKKSSREYKGKETENGDAPILHTGNKVHELLFPAGSIHFNIADGTYPISKPDRVEILCPIVVKNGINESEVRLRGEFTWSQETLNDNWRRGCYFLVKSSKFSVRVKLPEAKLMAPEKFIDEQYLSKAIGVGTNEDATTHLKELGINFTNSKPESIAAFFINAVTEERDIVLDFFLGSGTTAAVAQKMNRQYIGVEQMDYIETETIRRLNLVIQGEQGGVSKAVGWKGGGEFVYCELATANQKFVDAIVKAENEAELEEIWEAMQQKAFISYRVDLKTINKSAEDYSALSIEDKKRFLIETLDKNLLYVPYSDMESKEYDLSEEDKRLSREFYAKSNI